jgi:hypothetical protein
VKQRGRQGRTHGGTGAEPPPGRSSKCSSPWCPTSPRYWRERATLPLGAHPLAVGHPRGSGLGPAGEGGAHHRLNDLRPRAKSARTCPGRWREDEPPPQPETDSGSSCTSRSILEPEAPPEANKNLDYRFEPLFLISAKRDLFYPRLHYIYVDEEKLLKLIRSNRSRSDFWLRSNTKFK